MPSNLTIAVTLLIWVTADISRAVLKTICLYQRREGQHTLPTSELVEDQAIDLKIQEVFT